jgi:stalled ribosome rescue protein Dom34
VSQLKLPCASLYLTTTNLRASQMTLKIRVERIEFDAEQCSLRINGQNVLENEHVKMGQYHTIDLELERPFTVEKECWDSIFMELLDDACNPTKKAELAAVVMQEGLANVCLITSSMTVVKAKVERRIPNKSQVRRSCIVCCCAALPFHVGRYLLSVGFIYLIEYHCL